MFLQEVEKGIQGGNKGLLTGLPAISNAINNLQDGEYHVVGGMKKTGKNKFIHFFYIVMPYLMNPNTIDWIYYSLEMPLHKVQAQVLSLILYIKHKEIISEAQIFSKGEYKLTPEQHALVKQVYAEDIEPLFGKYTEDGVLITPGRILFINKSNPTGINKTLRNYFEARGRYEENTIQVERNGRIEQIKSKKYIREDGRNTITIIDHSGKVSKERGFNTKENIDKLSEYLLNLRNDFKGLYVLLSQFNRGLSSVERLKFAGELLQPTAEDFKSTG